ncbi:MAG: cyclic nucleotide-binding domain-containing protein [Acidobacteria bacterium]|nr:cyclic nucleotide-binding domain-containing protein [Acidobacteriota bacterium]
METSSLGKVYQPHDVIVRQGEVGNCMYVIQDGQVELIKDSDGHEIFLAELREGDFFGEMELFGKEPRAATARALSEVRVLTVDKKLLLRRIQEDPSLGFRIMQKLSNRVRELENELMKTTREHLDDALEMIRRSAS